MSYEVLRINDFDPMGLAPRIDHVQKVLANGEWGSIPVKKLLNKNLYQAKLDDATRLLFKIGALKERKFILLLGCIKDHNYARSRFPGNHQVSESDFEIPQNEEDLYQLVYVNTEEKRFQLLDKVISFDGTQNRVFYLPLPLIVVGSAGSGKTALMLEKMKTMSGQVLYTTHSKFLVENSRRVYYSNNYENDSQEVDFLSFKEFLQSVQVPQGKELTYQIFSTWWQRHQIGSVVKDPHKLFEEFRGVLTGSDTNCAYLSRENYLSLGVKQSIFIESEREAVYDLFEKYLRFLKEAGYFDQNLVSFQYLEKAVARYDFVVVDEVQDLTTIQIKLLLKHLKDEAAWFLCGDSNQIVHPNFFSWSRVKSMFYQAETHSPREVIQVLSNNFRNSQSVTALANRILILKNQRFGSIDKESNFLVTSMSSQEGQILHLQNKVNLMEDLDKKTSKSVNVAIVVPNEQVKERAKAYFKTPLVFTVHDAKGLEYKNIIIFDFISEYRDEFNDICAGVDSVSDTRELKFSRAKDKSEKSLEVYKFFINSLYVAVTRAIESLIIVESRTDHRAYELLGYPEIQDEFNWISEESNLEEWRAEARRLESQGKAEQAETIHKLILKDKQQVPWKVMDPKHFVRFGEAISRKQLTKIEKEDRTWLYHYSVADGVEPWQKIFEINKGKSAPQELLATINNKYHHDYLGKNYSNLRRKIESYGIDFQNPFGRTPVQTASVLGIKELVEALTEEGADANRRDLWGRTALGLSICRAITDANYRNKNLEGVYEALSSFPYSFQSRQKLWRLSNRPFEYFLFQLMFAHYYKGSVGNQAVDASYYLFDSEKLARSVAEFPDPVVPPHRKNRVYLSGILSKNEAKRDDPYNRGLFVRKERGHYVFNPHISFEIAEDTWMATSELLKLNRLVDQNFSGAALLRSVWEGV
jgi:UvrD-like helicase C-terminal domain